MPGQNSLRYNVGIVSTMTLDPSRSLFTPSVYEKSAPYMLDRKRVEPRSNQTPKAGQTLVFEFDKDSDLLNFMDFRFTVPSLNPSTDSTGADRFFIDTTHNAQIHGIPVNPGRDDLQLSTYAQGVGSGLVPNPQTPNQVQPTPNPCWVDYLGYFVIKKVTIRQASNDIQTFNGMDLFLYHMKFHNQETREHYRQLVGGWDNGPLNPSSEVAKAQTWREIIVPLDLAWFVGRVDKALPIVGVSRPVQVIIELENPEYWFLTTAPIQGSIEIPLRDVCLESTTTHLLKNERSAFLNILDSQYGLNWKSLDVQYEHDYQLSAAQHKRKAIVPINIKHACTSLFFVKRHSSDKKTKYATYWTNFLRVNRYSGMTGKEEFITPTDHTYEQIRVHNLFNNSATSNYYIYNHNWSIIPDDKFNCWGHMELGNLSNPTLNLEYEENHKIGTNYSQSTGSPVETDNNHVLDITTFTHQFIQHKSGEIHKVTN